MFDGEKRESRQTIFFNVNSKKFANEYIAGLNYGYKNQLRQFGEKPKNKDYFKLLDVKELFYED